MALIPGPTGPGRIVQLSGYHYHNPNDVNDPESVLNLMLPRASVDETVRLGGSYIIVYDYGSATVLDVFYSQRDSVRFGHNFSAGETYTWTIPVTAGGAIEFRGIATTFSIDFTKIVISSGNGAPTGAPRHDTTESKADQIKGIDGKTMTLQPLAESKTESNSMIRIND